MELKVTIKINVTTVFLFLATVFHPVWCVSFLFLNEGCPFSKLFQVRTHTHRSAELREVIHTMFSNIKNLLSEEGEGGSAGRVEWMEKCVRSDCQ